MGTQELTTDDAVRIARAAMVAGDSWRGADVAGLVQRHDAMIESGDRLNRKLAAGWARLIMSRVSSWYPEEVAHYRTLADAAASA